MKPEIPYEEIDVEIRRLVRLVNAVRGIQSISSCAGHDVEEEAIVSFHASDLIALGELARLLPFHGVRSKFFGGCPVMESIVITTRYSDESGLTHELRIAASPRSAVFQTIARVEGSLSGYRGG